MLSIIICDDSPVIIKNLQQMIALNIPSTEYQIDTFLSSDALVQAMEHDLSPDIALIDIKIGEESGILLAKALFPAGSHTQVIFVAGYMDHCAPVYQTERIYFLLKPINSHELQQTLNKAIEQLACNPEKCLILRSRTAIQRVPFSTIRYIESKARKIIVYCQDTSYEYYSTLTALLEQLPTNFVHCHKSFCVNMDFVIRMETNRFILMGEKPIPISQTKRAKTRKHFLDYLDQTITI